MQEYGSDGDGVSEDSNVRWLRRESMGTGALTCAAILRAYADRHGLTRKRQGGPASQPDAQPGATQLKPGDQPPSLAATSSPPSLRPDFPPPLGAAPPTGAARASLSGRAT